MENSTGKRDSKYEIRYKGVELVKGDAHSVGVMFGHLDGRTFDSSGFKTQTHAEWLAFVGEEFNTLLEVGGRIEMLSPEGSILQESHVGKSVSVDAAHRDLPVNTAEAPQG